MKDHWTDRLSEYLDGELPADEVRRLEGHLESCVACRRVLDDLKGVVEKAGRLEDRPPERDLWPGIAARIGLSASGAAGASGGAETPREPRFGRATPRRGETRDRRFTFTLPQLAAAAVALVALSGTATWLASGGLEDPAGPPAVAVEAGESEVGAPTEGGAQLTGATAGSRSGYDQAIANMETILFEGEGILEESTVRALRESLAKVDRAIESARAALAEDPANPYLRQHLAETMRKKATVLQQAVTLASSES